MRSEPAPAEARCAHPQSGRLRLRRRLHQLPEFHNSGARHHLNDQADVVALHYQLECGRWCRCNNEDSVDEGCGASHGGSAAAGQVVLRAGRRCGVPLACLLSVDVSESVAERGAVYQRIQVSVVDFRTDSLQCGLVCTLLVIGTLKI